MEPHARSAHTSSLLRWVALSALLGWATGCASLPTNSDRTVSLAFGAPLQTALGQLAESRRARASARSDSGFRLLDSVEAALTSRLALIEGAQRSLDLQYYAIHADASTEAILQRLRDAARRGVRVRILLDDFNSVGEDAQVLRLAFEPNVELRLFNPLPGPRNSMLGRIITSLHDMERMQKRMHNKLFIADSAWGIAGGRNLGDRYFGSSEEQNFVDLDVLAAGRIVREMAASFDRYWNDELAYPVQSLLSRDDLEDLRRPVASEGQSVNPTPHAPTQEVAASSTSIIPTVPPAEANQSDRLPMDLKTVPLVWAPSLLLADKPGKVGPGDDEVHAQDTLVDGLLHLMQQAQRDVLIVSPYFVPGAQIMALFSQMRQKGIRIRVLTNSLASNDAPAAHAGYMRYRDRLLALGVELYEMRSNPETAPSLAGSGGRSPRNHGSPRRGGLAGSKAVTAGRASLHSKCVIIDSELSVIGSMNLDLRSKLKNSEVALVIRSRELAQQVIRQVETTFASNAYRLERRDRALVWRAPAGASFRDSTTEPEADLKLRALVRLLAPFAPEDML